MLIPELVRKYIVFILLLHEKKAFWKMIQPKKMCTKLSACDLQLAAERNCGATHINLTSNAIKIFSITSGLLDLYLDLSSVICKAHNIKSIVGW